MTLLSGLMILIGLVGIVAPVLPGLLLVWAGVLVWAVVHPSAGRWTALGIATAILALGSVAKYVLPGRRLRDAGVPWRTLALGTALGIVGFFVIPVVGLFLGFLLGVYLAERVRLGTHTAAWPSTVEALKASGWSLAIELTTGLLIAALWVGVVLVAPST